MPDPDPYDALLARINDPTFTEAEGQRLEVVLLNAIVDERLRRDPDLTAWENDEP